MSAAVRFLSLSLLFNSRLSHPILHYQSKAWAALPLFCDLPRIYFASSSFSSSCFQSAMGVSATVVVFWSVGLFGERKKNTSESITKKHIAAAALLLATSLVVAVVVLLRLSNHPITWYYSLRLPPLPAPPPPSPPALPPSPSNPYS